MNKIFLCGNTGSMNRGCEAIVRSTIKVLGGRNGDKFLYTHALEQDRKLANDTGINLISYSPYPTRIHRIACAAIRKINKKSTVGQGFIQKPLFNRVTKADICLNIGGDTYCYGRPVQSIALNKFLYKKGIPNILWCCSIEEDRLHGEILDDLRKYKYIFAREQLTYDALINAGLEKNKVIKVCDPAFFLDKKEVILPEGFIEGNTVGINISEMTITPDNPSAYANVIATIRYILDSTDMSVCLIPHVYSIERNSNDYPILRKVFDEINDSRVSIVEREYDCEQLKYIISKCRFFIGARTHSTIAAYSSEIPTLVIGYSVKSKGIAMDLFGSYDGYVISYKDLTDKYELPDLFKNMVENESRIKERLHDFLPEYRKQLQTAVDEYICCNTCNSGEFEICDKEICSGCSACVNTCPVNAINMVSDSEGFEYPIINYTKCIKCGKCTRICPVANKVADTGNIPKVYSAVNNDENIRKSSSSGGVFSALAENIIADGGVVFGAGFDENNNVVHKMCDSIDGLSELRGSKYVQSKLGSTFIEVKKYLEQGRKVMFVGTSCQIGGLTAFLNGKSYENLYTVDFICHGVPSPEAWRKYLDERENEAHSKAKAVSFRNKALGWRKFSINITFNNNTEYKKALTEDSFLKGFISNIYLRPSCSLCSYKKIGRKSDITIADFWGIEKINPDLSDDKGVSLVLIHSAKGKALLQNCSDKITIIPQSLDDALKDNPSLIKSVGHSPLRLRFFKQIEKKSFDRMIKKYCGNSITSKIYRKIIGLF